jgi:hypothetical protein
MPLFFGKIPMARSSFALGSPIPGGEMQGPDPRAETALRPGQGHDVGVGVGALETCWRRGRFLLVGIMAWKT